VSSIAFLFSFGNGICPHFHSFSQVHFLAPASLAIVKFFHRIAFDIVLPAHFRQLY
jgi:hypothetical protein